MSKKRKMTRREFEERRERKILEGRSQIPKPKKMPYLYFAYGSNLNKVEMKRRCPYSRPIGKIVLSGWRLVFRGVADVVPSKGDRVVGALYEITDHCLVGLDRYEGFNPKGGGLYGKTYRRIKGTKRTVMFYRMERELDVHRPSEFYYERVRQGYKDWGLPMTTLIRAKIDSSRRRPEPEPEPDADEWETTSTQDGYQARVPWWRRLMPA